MDTKAVGNLKLGALSSISVEQSSSSHHNGRSHAVCHGAMPATGWLKWTGLQRAGLRGFALLLLAALAAAQAFAGETVLHSFTPFANGSDPSASVCFGPGGTYGTASGGGPNNAAGLVWKIDNHGRKTTLYGFTGGSDGAAPYSPLLCNADGSVYGTTSGGGASGAGTVFRVDAAGHEVVLYSFTGGPDGAYPYAGLAQDLAGNLYGTTSGGGLVSGYNGAGVVFKLDRHGNETVLYSFTGGLDGGYPNNVIRDIFGNIYGTTYDGGSDNAGVVFKLDRRGNETVLYSFTGGADGAYPYYGVVEDFFGNLYGTTANGGSAGYGVVFKVDTQGLETVLYSFTGGSDGAYPYAGVTLDLFGNLYGTTNTGGSAGDGVVFKVDTHRHESVLYNFPGGEGGANSGAGVVFDWAGNLYGDTESGGASGLGMVFKLNPAGHETVLYDFPATDGANPQAGVVQDSLGNLYGATPFGGLHLAGTVYKIDASGNESLLYNFTGGLDGGYPVGGVILGSDGNLYGVAGYFGQYNAGLLFKMDLMGNETVLYSFTGGSDGAYPNGVSRDPSGNLYGTTADGGSTGLGVVFKVNPSGNETVLHTFTGPEGKYPYAGVTLDSSGNLYGSTFYGGSLGHGVVYKVDTGGNYSVLHNFTGGADGGNPWGDLILDAAGNLYGTTWSGGLPSGDDPGVVFKIDTMGNFSVLYTFTGFSDGGGPRSNLVFDSSGNLYGTTEYGGIGGCPFFGCGVAFELNPSGQQTVLHSFSGASDGAEPGTGLILDAAGNLYGTTPAGGGVGFFSGAGVVYKVSPGGDSPAQLQAGQRSFKLSDFGPKHPLPWDVPKKTEAGICPPHMPPALALACRQEAR